MSDDGSQYAPFDQINRGNLDRLDLVFSYHTGDLGQGFEAKGHSFQATPVYWNGSLFISTSSNEVIAIDAARGTESWRYDTAIERGVGYSEHASRGVSLWHGNADVCPDRVFIGTLRGTLHAIDARTGERCSSFGVDGVVDLGTGIRNRRAGQYSVTSPVAVLDDRIIVGSSIGDNGAVDLEQGIVRALDPVNGAQLWQWDPIPRDPTDPASRTWQGRSASITGAANAWAPISVDPERRLVFVPTSSPSPDFYGGERLGENHYANSIVALDADTGQVRWFRQLVHHDVWDYDIPAQPSLTVIGRGGKEIPAVVVVTKTGMLYAFDRDSGSPIYGMTEKPVPQTDVPGERTHPTQPFSDIAIAAHHQLTEDDAFGIMFQDKASCREAIKASRSEGIFTPPSLAGTIEFPGWAGGMNWGGVALDPLQQIAVVNFMNLPGIIKLLPREAFDRARENDEMPDWQLTEMAGTPYGMARRMFVSSLGLPCTRPPWGEIVAIDLITGGILWRRPFGTVEDLSPVPIPGFAARALFGDWGAPNLGGPLVTSGNIVVIGAALDFYLRIFDVHSGEEIWRYRLPTSANSIPISYMHDSRQYIAVAVGGHSGAGTPRGDELMVFALRPEL